MRKAAIYPGTFDPLTLGHLDVIERVAAIFEHVVLAIVTLPPRKTPMFTLQERVDMAAEAVRHLPNVQVEPFKGLLVDYARQKDIHVLVRGIRAYSDFEYEFQMALMNRKMAADVETLFLMPKEAFSYISSSVVREIAEQGGDTSELVPQAVQVCIDRKCRRAGVTGGLAT
jgi:pantetheine-phosphate adenylyltransferase